MADRVFALGIDVGTSGVRTAIVDQTGQPISEYKVAHAPQPDAQIDARLWWQSVSDCLAGQVARFRSEGHDPNAIRHAAIDATSGTMVIVDRMLVPVTPALMYDSKGFEAEAETIARHAPTGSITRGSNSATARMLRLQSFDTTETGAYLLHQADYILSKMVGAASGSDDNNALKLGFDPETRQWPSWFSAAGIRTELLPSVRPVGGSVATLNPSLAERLGLSCKLQLYAGTTDSIAAFIASGADQIGDGVTSLGTTLAVKLLSDRRIDDAAAGVYSHKLGAFWLVGGASNTGGGVLASLFSREQLIALSSQIDPHHPTGLDYYPLLQKGERFPVNDPNLAPKLTPRPEDDHIFLQGLFESMARIENAAYGALSDKGAPVLSRLFSAGGGAGNPIWTAIRQQTLGMPFAQGRSEDAAVGSALLALRSAR